MYLCEVYGAMPFELVGLNEDSVTMDEAKFRRKGYGKNDGSSMSQKIEDQEPWEIVYCDIYISYICIIYVYICNYMYI
jgi:hypothetical protein